MTELSVKQQGRPEKWASEVGKNLRKAIDSKMLTMAELAAGAIRVQIFQDFPTGRGGLARSYTARLLTRKDGNVRSGALSDSVYADIQDRGGSIYPKTAKALAVPWSPLAKSLSARGVGPRDFPKDLQLVWPKGSPKGYLITSSAGRWEGHYILTKRVRLSGTKYLTKARVNVAPVLASVMVTEISKGVEKAKP